MFEMLHLGIILCKGTHKLNMKDASYFTRHILNVFNSFSARGWVILCGGSNFIVSDSDSVKL
jgi:hypothetical protein